MRFDLAQITAQKSRGREQQSQFVFFDQCRILRDFQRVRISNNAHALDQWIPKGDGRSEAVKKRERGENGVVFLRVEKFPELRNVADNVSMAEPDSFRLA